MNEQSQDLKALLLQTDAEYQFATSQHRRWWGSPRRCYRQNERTNDRYGSLETNGEQMTTSVLG